MYFDIVFGLLVDNSGEAGLNRKKDIFLEKKRFFIILNK